MPHDSPFESEDMDVSVTADDALSDDMDNLPGCNILLVFCFNLHQRYDDANDDLFDLKTDNDECGKILYDDPFDSKENKIKDFNTHDLMKLMCPSGVKYFPFSRFHVSVVSVVFE
ncbi:hypothetical protein Tco_0979906 [Tanacetum coccineum]